MKKILATVSFLVLASNGASAQYTTNCTPGFLGNVVCTTNHSDPFYEMNQRIRMAEQEQAQRQYQQQYQEQLQRQHEQRLFQQQQQHKERMEQQAHNEWWANMQQNSQLLMRIQAERQAENINAPEWQAGGLVSREEGKSPDGRSTCIYQTSTGRAWVQGKFYVSFTSLVPRTASCPSKMSISKTTGERK
jgi:hypothetical protein